MVEASSFSSDGGSVPTSSSTTTTSWHPLFYSSSSSSIGRDAKGIYPGARLESFDHVLARDPNDNNEEESIPFRDTLDDSIRILPSRNIGSTWNHHLQQQQHHHHQDPNDIQLAFHIPTESSIPSPPSLPPTYSTHEKRYNKSPSSPAAASARTGLSTLKTGTTIVGIHLPHCQTIILGADTRATNGNVVADKECEKIHALARNVWCCGAGTSGDIDALVHKVRYRTLLTHLVESTLVTSGEEESRNRVEQPKSWSRPLTQEEKDIGMTLGYGSIPAICHFFQKELYKGKGEIGANLVLGGFDPYTGDCTLLAIHPHGSMDAVPYTALGSGGLAAMGTLEANYDSQMSLEEGLELVKEAILAGIKNDLGSGSQVDICILGGDCKNGTCDQNGGVQYQRCVVKEESLVELDGQESIDFELFEKHSKYDKDCIVGGVNGFGSLPYSIKSKKVLMENESCINQVRDQWLDNIIDE